MMVSENWYRADFVRWLRSHKPRAVVGMRVGNGWAKDDVANRRPHCPLGAWAAARGLEHGFTGEWAERFWMAVDASGPDFSGITARKCLQLLGEKA